MRPLAPPLFTLALLAGLPLCAPAAEPLPDFDRDVKPVLAQHCFKCHSAEATKGGLRLDAKPSMLKGGDSGAPAIVPGQSHKSRLIALVTTTDPDDAMPPKGERLKADEVALLRRWIDTGAHATTQPADTAAVLPADPPRAITAEDRQFWSFRAPQASEPAAPKNAAWARTRLDRFVLARLEEAGLAPSAEAAPAALLRRLTFDLTGLPPTPDEVGAFLADASPAAYERAADRLLASPAFGQHMASLWLPLARYAEDQAHQVGSDTKLAYPNAFKYRDWVVGAFNRDLPYDRFVALQIAADAAPGATPADQAALGFLGLGPKYYNRGRLDVMADEWEDRIDTVTRTTLGLTVACARCHDHKFDPIPQADYYALAGIFAGTKMVNKTAAGVAQKDAKAEEVGPDVLHVVEDGTPTDLNLFIRGNVDRKGPIVPRRFLSILTPPPSGATGGQSPPYAGSGRRELAVAIVSPANPLTARVMVNRVWGQFFGQYLVATPSNFGKSGQPPTDPALLDDLAVRFMAQGWSVKQLVREIVTSAAYRQSADIDPAKVAVDPANGRLWRMNRRRLTVEQWRDALLAVSGELDPAGGKSIDPISPTEKRRTLYARVSRLSLNALLMQFDYPDANVHAEKRSVTTTPAQKLFALNSPFALARAKALAARLATECPETDAARVARAYALLFARAPAADEMALALDYLAKPADDGKLSRWARYAQALMASNEASYVD